MFDKLSSGFMDRPIQNGRFYGIWPLHGVWFVLGWATSSLLIFVYLGFTGRTTGDAANLSLLFGQNSLLAATPDQVEHTGLPQIVEHQTLPREAAQLNTSHTPHEPCIQDNNRLLNLSYCQHPFEIEDSHLIDCATYIGHNRKLEAQHGLQTLDAEAAPRRVAFLFLARGDMPHEALWRRFFQGHEELYSVYVHSHPDFVYKNDSFFYQHQVPSKIVERMSISLVQAVRRLLAYSIIEPKYGASNFWFVILCESSIPIRSFNFTYTYMMESQHSFVESFHPKTGHSQWVDSIKEPPILQEQVRKGEVWMALQLHHAHMVLEDWSLYYTYKQHCTWGCTPDEQYIHTLLAIKDPSGIENRTVMYVDWTHEDHGSSPHTYSSADLTIEWFKDIQGRTIDQDGQYHDTSIEAELSETKRTSRSCFYNGVPNSTCFLFSRKIDGFASKHLESLPASVLGY